MSPGQKKMALQEVEMLRPLNHPNIIRLIETIDKENAFYIISEYCNSGDLKELIESRKEPFTTIEVAEMLAQVITKTFQQSRY